MIQNIWKNKNSPQYWEISAKYNILTVEEKQIAHIGNTTQIILDVHP